MQNTMSAHQEVSSQEAWRVTTLDARTIPRTVSTREVQALALPIMMADSESDHEDMPPLLPPEDTDSDDNEELPALLPNAAARQRPQAPAARQRPQAPGPCQYRHRLAGGFAKPGRQG
jgi:hypothetical protein